MAGSASAPELIKGILMGIPGGCWAAIIAMQVSYLILGMFLDLWGFIAITTPVFFPVVRELGFDPLWFGILFIVNMQMAYLTPPYGFNLFYMRGVAPPEITMGDIYRSVIPYVALQAAGLAIIMIFPRIVMFLPNLIFGS